MKQMVVQICWWNIVCKVRQWVGMGDIIFYMCCTCICTSIINLGSQCYKPKLILKLECYCIQLTFPPNSKNNYQANVLQICVINLILILWKLYTKIIIPNLLPILWQRLMYPHIHSLALFLHVHLILVPSVFYDKY